MAFNFIGIVTFDLLQIRNLIYREIIGLKLSSEFICSVRNTVTHFETSNKTLEFKPHFPCSISFINFIQGEWLKKGLGEEIYNAALANTQANTPLGLAVTPDEVAEVIYGFIDLSKVVTGETYLVDGGYHLTI